MHEATLENGLRVVVAPSPAPVVAIYLWIDAGAAAELPEESGAAHFLEHMVFKGTPSRGVGVAAATIEGLGGDLNAFTSHDETVVHATVEAEAWREALDVVSDMVQNATLDPTETGREALVVLEEIRGYADDPDTVLEEASAATLFADHAYGRPILGTAASVQRLTSEALRQFRDREHGANRAILSVAGDVSAEEVIRVARATFGGWRRSGAPTSVVASSVGAPGAQVQRVAGRFSASAVEIAFPAFALGHPDAAALDVLATALGDGAASLLTTRLQFESSVATDIWASASLRRYGGALSFGFAPQEGQTAAAIEQALDEIYSVARRGLPAALVSRAKDALLADALFSTETVDGRAYDHAFYLARFGDARGRERWRREVAAVSAEDIRRVAQAWLRHDACQVSVLDGKAKQPRLEEALRRSAPPARQRRPGPTRHVAPNGAVLIVLPDAGELVAVQALGLGGALFEAEKTAGTGSAWERMVTAGAGDLDATAFGEAVDDIAGTIDAFSGRSTFGISGSFPATWLHDGLDLFGSALTEPRFDDDEWERILEEMREDVRTRSDRPDELLDELSWASAFPDHPWRLPVGGTAASLAAIHPKRLKQWHRQSVTADNLVLVVAGGVDPGDVIDALTPWMAALPASKPAAARPSPGPMQVGSVRGRAGKEQVHVGLYARGVTHRDADRSALRVAAAALDGQGGRLFLRLREERGLAYGVWAQSLSGEDGGLFSMGLSTDPARAGEARAALRAELDRLIASPPDEDEVARYRRMLSGHSAMSLQRVASRALDAASGERLGLPWGLSAHREALQQVDAAGVREALRRVVASGLVEVVVEPLR
jgi:zinc protease